jgi:hypothetical protein
MEPLNVPEVVPSVVLLSEIVGVAEVLQQIPHADKIALPLEVTAPPLLAEVAVIADTAVVVTVNKVGIS